MTNQALFHYHRDDTTLGMKSLNVCPISRVRGEQSVITYQKAFTKIQYLVLPKVLIQIGTEE
jgi:hypothetical protein